MVVPDLLQALVKRSAINTACALLNQLFVCCLVHNGGTQKQRRWATTAVPVHVVSSKGSNFFPPDAILVLKDLDLAEQVVSQAVT